MAKRSKNEAADFGDIDVLIIEDDDDALQALDAMLKTLGVSHRRQASTVGDALIAIRRQHPDAVLLDASLQGLPAHEIVRELTDLGIPFVVVTGYSRGILPAAFAEPPMLRKPVSLGVLKEALLDLVSEARMKLANPRLGLANASPAA